MPAQPCIRLPFGIHRKTGRRYPFVGLGNWREQIEIITAPMTVDPDDVMRNQYRERVMGPFRVVFPLDGIGPELPLCEKVKRQISVRQLVEQYVELNDSGVGKCPFHDDQHASFSVNDMENYWHCFSGCGGGSVIDFWMKLNNMTFREAVEDLSQRLGVQ